jgi:hypothetical protein
MKLYFFEDGVSYVADFANAEDEPKDAIASFTIADGKSTFAPRYVIENKKLVDKYPTKTDEEVAVILQQAEATKAAELAAQHSAQSGG